MCKKIIAIINYDNTNEKINISKIIKYACEKLKIKLVGIYDGSELEKSEDLRIFTFTKNKVKEMIHYNDIFYFEKKLRKATVITKFGEIEFYTSGKELLKNLDKNIFLKTHESYIVNLLKIKGIKKNKIKIGEIEKEIPISKKYIKEVYKRFNM